MVTSQGSFEEKVCLVLVEDGFITSNQLTQAQEAKKVSGVGLLDTLLALGMLTQEALTTVLTFQLRIPVVDLRRDIQVDPEVIRLVPEEYARKNAVLPLGFDIDGSLRIATRMPRDSKFLTELSSVTRRQIKFVLTMGGRLEELIDRAYSF